MEQRPEFAAGDRNNSNGTSSETQEASIGVFEDGQKRSLDPVRPVKDGESYVYGDSRPDETEPSDTFTAIDDSPMMTTTREDFPEAKREDPAFLETHRVGQNDHIEAHLRKDDPNQGEESVLVENEKR